MNNFKILFALLLLFLGMVQLGCREGRPLNPEKNEVILKESQLPEIVNTSISDWRNNKSWNNIFENLDSNRVKAIDKTLKTGPWSNGRLFIIGDKKFHLEWNENREGAPFILFDKKLYYTITRYGEDEKDFNEYGMINLERKLKY